MGSVHLSNHFVLFLSLAFYLALVLIFLPERNQLAEVETRSPLTIWSLSAQ